MKKKGEVEKAMRRTVRSAKRLGEDVAHQVGLGVRRTGRTAQKIGSGLGEGAEEFGRQVGKTAEMGVDVTKEIGHDVRHSRPVKEIDAGIKQGARAIKLHARRAGKTAKKLRRRVKYNATHLQRKIANTVGMQR